MSRLICLRHAEFLIQIHCLVFGQCFMSSTAINLGYLGLPFFTSVTYMGIKHLMLDFPESVHFFFCLLAIFFIYFSFFFIPSSTIFENRMK